MKWPYLPKEDDLDKISSPANPKKWRVFVTMNDLSSLFNLNQELVTWRSL